MTILLLTCNLFLNAQLYKSKVTNVDPKTLNTSGGSFSNDNFVFNWSFGEVFSTTLSKSEKLILTTDFLQSKDVEIILIPVTDTVLPGDSIQLSIKAFPNPVYSNLYLTIDQFKVKLLTVSLYNAQGNQLYAVDELLNTAQLYSRVIPMSNYAKGTYLLAIKYVFNNNHYRTKVFKIIKM